MSLRDWGWQSSFAELLSPGLEPARVISHERDHYLVITASGERSAESSGRLLYAAEPPVAGDWVGLRSQMVIDEILPRRTRLSRRQPGKRDEEQVLAANIDLVLVVTGLDHDFNLRRLERYKIVVAESGADLALILNKADLHPDVGAAVASVRGIAPGAPVLAISAQTGEGLDAVRDLLQPGRTAALAGSSGAGKSTLLNRLLGSEQQETTPVRAGDNRGRHTTTRRQLFPIPGGGLLLDQPGIRELQFWGGDAGDAFGEIAKLAKGCRYADCRHSAEPGCAVIAAASQGTLDPGRLESYRKLSKELAFAERQTNVAAAQAEKRRWKSIHRSMKRWRREN